MAKDLHEEREGERGKQSQRPGRNRERKRGKGRDRERWRQRQTDSRAQRPSQNHLALAALGGRLVLNALLEPVCVYIHMHLCVCTSDRTQASHPEALPSLHREAGAPDCRGAGSSVTVCLCREAGRREEGSAQCQCGSACVGAAAWGRRTAACTRTCACLRL